MRCSAFVAALAAAALAPGAWCDSRVFEPLMPPYAPPEAERIVMSENVPAWVTLQGSTLSDWPPHVAEQDGLVFGTSLLTGQGVLVAPRWRDGPALLYVWMFSCRGCPQTDGGLRERLEEDGFMKTRCAPQFTTSVYGTKHAMQGYMREVAPGHVYNVTASGPADYVVFGVSWTDHVVCSKYQTMSTCRSAGDGTGKGEMQCEWDLALGMCSYAYCPHPEGIKATFDDVSTCLEAECPERAVAPVPLPPTPPPTPPPRPQYWTPPPATPQPLDAVNGTQAVANGTGADANATHEATPLPPGTPPELDWERELKP